MSLWSCDTFILYLCIDDQSNVQSLLSVNAAGEDYTSAELILHRGSSALQDNALLLTDLGVFPSFTILHALAPVTCNSIAVLNHDIASCSRMGLCKD